MGDWSWQDKRAENIARHFHKCDALFRNNDVVLAKGKFAK